MELFRQVIDDCGLMDVGYSGSWYTWERGNLPEINIHERLDRALANESWFSFFPCGQIRHFSHLMSDHYPLLVSLVKERNNIGIKRFHFETWWIMEETFEGTI